MERTENLIMQEDRWKPLKEMNLTDDFLFDVATAELENCKTIIELSTGLQTADRSNSSALYAETDTYSVSAWQYNL